MLLLLSLEAQDVAFHPGEFLFEHIKTIVERFPSLFKRIVRHFYYGRERITILIGREERVAHEVSILRRLSGLERIAQLAPQQPDHDAILLEDVHGAPLARTATPMDASRLVNLALDLARAVAAIHQRGVVHRDINPGNILVSDEGQFTCLIDFALATTFAGSKFAAGVTGFPAIMSITYCVSGLSGVVPVT